MTCPDEIARVAALGWRLYPSSSHAGSRAAMFKQATDAATADPDQLGEWARRWPGCGWRVVMQGSGIWAVDLDAPGPDHAGDGIAAMQRLVERHGPLPAGPRIRSGGGGVVLFFAFHGEVIASRSGYPAPGIDPRPGHGRQSVTLPPSIHHRTRRPYRWLMAPWEAPPPDAPAWLVTALAPPPAPPEREPTTVEKAASTPYAEAALRNAYQRVACAPSGSRNHTLNADSFALVRFIEAGTLSLGQVAQAMAAAAAAIGLDRNETRATLRSALRLRGIG